MIKKLKSALVVLSLGNLLSAVCIGLLWHSPPTREYSPAKVLDIEVTIVEDGGDSPAIAIRYVDVDNEFSSKYQLIHLPGSEKRTILIDISHAQKPEQIGAIEKVVRPRT